MPPPEAKGGGPEALSTTRGQEQCLGGANLCPMPGVAAGRSNPTSKEPWLCRCRRAERSYSMFNVRRGGREEIPLVQGKAEKVSRVRHLPPFERAPVAFVIDAKFLP